MEIEKILNLIGADQLAPRDQGQIRELIEVLIETPENAAALERLLFLIGANKLDPETIQTVTENLQAVIEVASRELLASISKTDLARRKIKREYLTKINESSVGDPDIANLSNQMPVKKNSYKWDHGFGSDVMKQRKEKSKVTDYKWDKDVGLSPLSGKTYKVK